MVPSKKQPESASKNGTAGALAKKCKFSSSSDSSKDNDSEEDQDPKSKVADPSKKVLVAATKNGALTAPKKKVESSDDSESDDSSSSDDVKVTLITLGKKPAAVPQNVEDSSDSSSDSSSDEENGKKNNVKMAVSQPKKLPSTTVKNGSVAVLKKKDESSDSSEESPDDEDENDTMATSQAKNLPTFGSKNASVVTSKKGTETSDFSDDSESDEDEALATKVVPSKKSSSATETKESKQKKADLKEADSDSSSEEEPRREKMKSQPIITPNAGKQSAKATKNGSSSDEGSSDDELTKAQLVKKLSWKPTRVSKRSSESEEQCSKDNSSSEEDASAEEEEQPSKSPNKNDSDVDMVDAVSSKTESRQAAKFGEKSPQTPVTIQVQTEGSKTLFVGNLSFSVEQADVENFFKDAGEIVEMRFASDHEGAFKGYGHIEFATVAAAQKALKLDGRDLLGRSVRLDLAKERGSYTPFNGKERNSYQKGGRAQRQTIFIRGFDRSSGEDQVRSALEEHFGTCGELSRVSIPKNYCGDELKGIAYLDFKDTDSFNKALELNGSELGGFTLMVEEAKSRGDNRDYTGSGRGGRYGVDWFGGGVGRFGGGGRRRGAPNNPSMSTAGTGNMIY